MIENSRLANQYGTPEYMEANDPKRKESLAGWHSRDQGSFSLVSSTNGFQLSLLMQKTTALTISTMVKVFGEPSSLRMIQIALRTLHLRSRVIVQNHHVQSNRHSSDNRHAPSLQHPHQQYTRRLKDREITSRILTERTQTAMESQQPIARLLPKATWLLGSPIPMAMVLESTPLLLATAPTTAVLRVRQMMRAQFLRHALPTSRTTQLLLLELNNRAMRTAKLTFCPRGQLAAGDHPLTTTTSPLDPLLAPAVDDRQLNLV